MWYNMQRNLLCQQLRALNSHCDWYTVIIAGLKVELLIYPLLHSLNPLSPRPVDLPSCPLAAAWCSGVELPSSSSSILTPRARSVFSRLSVPVAAA